MGDSHNFLVRALGGAGGAGLITRVVRGYTFVSRHYEPGDRIFLIGFSRGAYTARAVAGLIAARGLLDARKLDLTDKEAAYRLGSSEWFEYRRAALATKAKLLDQLLEIAVDLPGFLSRPSPDTARVGATIEAVAVWDTVGALGIPRYNRVAMRLDAFQFADTVLSPIVRHGLHAIAVDEQRADFTPTLWDADARIVQVLLPGAHSDVGGGYPAKDNQSGLSDGGLEWMTTELGRLGVRFAATPAFAPRPDPAGIGHEPWTQPPWLVLPTALRIFPLGLELHHSVIERMKRDIVPLESGRAPYAPRNLATYITGRTANAGVVVV